MNKPVVNIRIQIFVWIYIFQSVGYFPRSAIARLYGKTIFSFVKKKNKLVNCLPNDCIIPPITNETSYWSASLTLSVFNFSYFPRMCSGNSLWVFWVFFIVFLIWNSLMSSASFHILLKNHLSLWRSVCLVLCLLF